MFHHVKTKWFSSSQVLANMKEPWFAAIEEIK